MKGSTHLAIGAAIGTAAVLYYPFRLTNDIYYVAAAAFSALSPDMDGTNLLSAKLGPLARLLRGTAFWGGLSAAAFELYLYSMHGTLSASVLLSALVAFILSLIAGQGALRNALVSLVGCGIVYAGLHTGMNGLLWLGGFVAVAPWLHHRGMTHTVWALLLWGYIGLVVEQDTNVQGLAVVAAAGYASHLLADTLTPSGVKWLYPLMKKSFKLPF